MYAELKAARRLLQVMAPGPELGTGRVSRGVVRSGGHEPGGNNVSERLSSNEPPTGEATADPDDALRTEVALVKVTVPGSALLPSPAGGRYELLGEIARGGMGVVYRATDTVLGREVAVKVLQERFVAGSTGAQRFVHEARITSQLQHPGIPAVHDLGNLPGGRPFLAMKLVKGRTLEELLKERPDSAADRSRFVAIFEQICQAVAYAHDHKVVHRDLKPANVMVGAFGEVQVMDWGLAKLLSGPAPDPGGDRQSPAEPTGETQFRIPSEDDWSPTQTGSVLGTPAFMPPEQAIGAVDQIDARSDVFGLGGMLCSILTGSPPYVGSNAESTRQLAARAKLDDAFARLDACGAEPGLVALCKRCLSAEKANRPVDADEVARAVTGLRAAADERARQAELERARAEVAAAEQHKRRRVQLTLAATFGLLLIGAGAVAWWADRQASQRKVDAENRERDERERLSRNSEAIVLLLDRCESALRADDAPGATLALDQAERRTAEGRADHLTARLGRCRADVEMLRDMDRIDNLRWTIVEGQLGGHEKAVPEWSKAFQRYGIAPGSGPAEEVVERLNSSFVRTRHLTALDQSLAWTHSADLLANLRAADTDPFRSAVRAAQVSRDGKRLQALGETAEALKQPAWFAIVLGELPDIPTYGREQILRGAARGRP